MPGSSIKTDINFLFAPEPRLEAHIDNTSFVPAAVDLNALFATTPPRSKTGVKGFIDKINIGVTSLLTQEMRTMRAEVLGEQVDKKTSQAKLSELNREFKYCCKKVELGIGKESNIWSTHLD